nr:MAG TPA: hypothetical protein [Caudoviricetes sp.]
MINFWSGIIAFLTVFYIGSFICKSRKGLVWKYL